MREGATERQRHNREHSSETVTSVDSRRPSLPDQQNEGHITRATAQLPGLQIEIVHRQSAAGDAEQISINLQAVPSFEAFGRFLEATNPLAFWAQAAQMAWLPWLEAGRALMLPGRGVPPQIGSGKRGRSPS